VSKTSKPRDRWRQLHADAHTRHPDWCKGCGYYKVANGVHRGQHRDRHLGPPGGHRDRHRQRRRRLRHWRPV